MRRFSAVAVALLFVAASAFAQSSQETNRVHYPAHGFAKPGGGGGQNLPYGGGPVLTVAKVVLIFWGSSFNDTTSPDWSYAREIQNFRNQFGTTAEYNTITQYYQGTGSKQFIQQTNLGLGTADWFDSANPVPTNVTDASVQAEVVRYLASNAFDGNTIYEVVIPPTSYSSDGNQTSCGGPNLYYCAYHGWFSNAGRAIKYSIQPYPSCGGCTVAGWTAAQNQEHFVCHETREAVTDPQINAWIDRRRQEADDRCAWSPSPFIGSNGYGYQYEWSNANNGCVRTR